MRFPLFLAAVALVACGGPVDPLTAARLDELRPSSAGQHAPACPGAGDPESARCHARILVDELAQPLAATAPAGFGPAYLRAAYNVTGVGDPTTTIAIVDAKGYAGAEKDLAVYRAQFGLPPCTTANGCFLKVNQNGVAGSYPRDDTGWAQETALDLDMASAMCPNCHLLLVEANSASYADLGTAVNTAARLGARVISNSYGGAEPSSAATIDAAYYDHPGIAVTVSSGDSGFGVQFPASSPHVTAVGGTRLVRATNARGWDETAWSGAGSGCSAAFAKPAWQTDVGCARRTVADVSAVADPATGVAVYGPVRANRSGWMVFGGTSVAAPVIGGIYAVNGGGGNYGSDPYANVASLWDVTSGSNGSCGGSYLCTAGAGFDGPTGLGTPNGSAAF